MPDIRLETKVRRRPGVALIDLNGEIDAAAEETLTAAYEEAASGGTETILLNFAGVDYINSTGIALIVGLLAQARRDRDRNDGLRPGGALPGDLRDHPPVGLHADLPGRGERDRRAPCGIDRGGGKVTNATVTMDVRVIGPGTSIIDITGDITCGVRGRVDGRVRRGERR